MSAAEEGGSVVNLRQAAQQALEALEKVKTDADKQPPVYPWDIWRMWVDRAITNLRAALSEPEQEPDGISWLKRDSGYFTAPTPRKPLTDEEMRECAQAMNAEPLAEGWPELIKFARAIERAHGIGEQT